jgi:hypothetical protein
MTQLKMWDCQIGEVARALVPDGADKPMRDAVRAAYKELTGEDDLFIFSGWGSQLSELQRATHENREPLYATYGESSIEISLECQSGWAWTAAVVGGVFKEYALYSHEQKHTPAEALRALADQFEKQAQHEFFYKQTGVVMRD